MPISIICAFVLTILNVFPNPTFSFTHSQPPVYDFSGDKYVFVKIKTPWELFWIFSTLNYVSPSLGGSLYYWNESYIYALKMMQNLFYITANLSPNVLMNLYEPTV